VAAVDLPELIASRYRVISERGRGGMGVVYVVEHVNTGDRLALKLLQGHAVSKGDALERFKREARASALIRSEHVVRVTDADVAPELDGAPFFVMELLEGHDFEEVVKRRGRLPFAEVVQWLEQAARALDRAHAIGIVHRDLKPANLFLHRTEDGREILKIVDFGISKFDAQGPPQLLESTAPPSPPSPLGITQTGAAMGTPLYMSPEQTRGRPVGPESDVWALGLIAVRLLTAEHYWTATTIPDLIVQILNAPMPRPSERWPYLPPAVDGWLARSLARDAKARFAQAGEQVRALAAALDVPVAAAVEARAMLPAPPLEASADGAAPAVIVGTTTDAFAKTALASTGTRRRSRALAAGAGVALLGAAGALVALRDRSGTPAAIAPDSAASVAEALSARPHALTPAASPESVPAPAPVASSLARDAAPAPAAPAARRPRPRAAPSAATPAAPFDPTAP